MNVKYYDALVIGGGLAGLRAAVAAGESITVHPNDHVNRSQSSNDVFPTAMHAATLCLIEDRLFPAMDGCDISGRVLLTEPPHFL